MASNMWKEAQLHLSDKLRYNNQIKLLQYPFLNTRPVGIKTKVLLNAGKDLKTKQNKTDICWQMTGSTFLECKLAIF